MSTLALVDMGTGELVDAVDARALLAAAGIANVGDAHSAQLAAFIDEAEKLRCVASEAKGIAGDELISRMDRDGKWTLRTDGFEVKSASPEAGAVAYDTARLHEALSTLVTVDVISPAGARAALEPVKPMATVSYDLLRRIAGLLDDFATNDKVDAVWWDAVLGEVEDVLLTEPAVTYRQHAAGIKALLKIGHAREAIEACRIAVQPPRRTAKVRRTA